MSNKLLTWVWDHGPSDRTEMIVLAALADQANDAGVSWPSVETIARRCRMTDRSLRRVLRRLEEGGWLTTTERPGRSSVYRILTPDTQTGRTEGQGDVQTGGADTGDRAPRTQGTGEPLKNPQEPKVRATHMSDDWCPDGRTLAWAVEKGWAMKEIDLEIEAFKIYWLAEGGQRARKRDWDRALQTWLNRTSPEEHRKRKQRRA